MFLFLILDGFFAQSIPTAPPKAYLLSPLRKRGSSREIQPLGRRSSIATLANCSRKERSQGKAKASRMTKKRLMATHTRAAVIASPSLRWDKLRAAI